VIRAERHFSGTAYLIAITHPNRRGRPVYQRLWAAVRHHAQWKVVDGESWLASLDLERKALVNRGKACDYAPLLADLKHAVSEAKKHGQSDFQKFRAARDADMAGRLKTIAALQDRRALQVELGITESKQPQAIKNARLADERKRLDDVFKSWMDWVKNSMTLEDQPYLQVLAVFAGKGAD